MQKFLGAAARPFADGKQICSYCLIIVYYNASLNQLEGRKTIGLERCTALLGMDRRGGA